MKKRQNGPIIIVSILVLAVVSLLAAVLITNNGKLSISGLTQLFTGKQTHTTEVGFAFDTGDGTAFAELDGGLAVASVSGVQVFGADGKKSFSEIFEMTNPTVTTAGKNGAVYDLGGKILKVFSTTGVLGTMKTDGNIISASMNSSGTLTLCTQESGGYKASVSVYKAGAYDATPQYKWYSGNGYIVSAVLSSDGKSLAVLTLTGSGSRVVFCTVDSTKEKGSCVLKGKLALALRFIDNDHVLALESGGLERLSADGTAEVLTNYSDKYLAAWAQDGIDYTAVALSDYMVGDKGRLVTVDKNGKTLATLETSRRVVTMSAAGGYLAVLYGDGFAIYDRNLKECTQSTETAGIVSTIMHQDGSALLMTSHSASVVTVKAG